MIDQEKIHNQCLSDESEERIQALEQLGSNFSSLLDKQQAYFDLVKLTSDKDRYIKAFASHSLGRVSIFSASQAEKDEDCKKELEKAIKYFEIAAQESSGSWVHPSEFCLPFYRSFSTIIFKNKKQKKKWTDSC